MHTADYRFHVVAKLVVAVLFAGGLGLCIGCGGTQSEGGPTATPASSLPSDEQIRQLLDEVLDYTFERRLLNTRDHAAWQVLHGALAFGRQFQVEHEGELVSAVDHILRGGYLKGWTVQRGDLLDPKTQRYGLRAILEQGTKSGQGHADQWLAVLAQCELPPDQTIVVADHTYTMEDYVRQVQLDIYRNVQHEYSWTLIALTTYLPTNAVWKAADGSQWSIEQLVQAEAEREVGDGACGGTHRLIGLSMALNQHLASGGQLLGPWKLAEQRIQEGIELARRHQNSDGSFSANYLTRPGASPDLAQNLRTSGHVLEFLALSLTDEQLREPWVKRAVVDLCDLFRKSKNIPLECGSLYHAAHGLVLYRQRVFGPRDFKTGGPTEVILTGTTEPNGQSK